MITINFQGRLGNNLFQYCFGRILAEKMGLMLGFHNENESSRWLARIPGADVMPSFKEISKPVYGEVRLENPLKLSGHKVDMETIIKHKGLIELYEFFGQRYEYYKENKEKIKKWLRPDIHFSPRPKTDLVIHVRCYHDEGLKNWTMPYDYYKHSIETCKTINGDIEKIFICTDNKDDPLIVQRLIQDYDAEISNLNEEEDFCFIMSFNNIVICQSTFSWWASFLSNASNIFFPESKRGPWYEEQSDIDLRVDDEKRYKYISVKND